MDTTPYLRRSGRINDRKLRGMTAQKTPLAPKVLKSPVTEKPSLVLALCYIRLYTYINYEQMCRNKSFFVSYWHTYERVTFQRYFLEIS